MSKKEVQALDNIQRKEKNYYKYKNDNYEIIRIPAQINYTVLQRPEEFPQTEDVTVRRFNNMNDWVRYINIDQPFQLTPDTAFRITRTGE